MTAVISSQKKMDKTRLKFEIDTALLEEIKAYMAYADVKDIDHFFAEAAHFVFSKDKGWKDRKKQGEK